MLRDTGGFAATTPPQDHGVFGKLNLVEGRWQDVFAETVTDVRVASVQKAALTEVIESLLHRDASTRLATLLLNLSEHFGESNGAARPWTCA
jgi:hypothetical protein